jgi:hypothetical protein
MAKRAAPRTTFCIIFWYVGYVFNANTTTALATAAIAYFTWTIKGINRSQLSYTQQIERAYISGGGVPQMQHLLPPTEVYPVAYEGHIIDAVDRPAAVPTGNFELHINNYGKTPGELREIGFGFCEVDKISPAPHYDRRHFRDWIGPGTGSRPIHLIRIPKGLANPAIYGRFYYRDIFGGNHSCGFIQTIGPNGETSPILAPAVYTEERDEPK